MAIRRQDIHQIAPLGISLEKYGLVPVEQSTDDQLEAKLTRYLELKPMASEFEKLKKELKPLFDGQNEIVIGRYKVVGKTVFSPEKTIKAFSYWKWEIQPAV